MSEEQENSQGSEQFSKIQTVSFAPADLTDGRKSGSWRTRYPEEANKKIIGEAWYLAVLLLIIPILIIGIHQDFGGYIIIPAIIKKYSYAWIGGTSGGILFTIKWLYHAVARNWWNEDRWLWRKFTPHISGALAFSFIILISSGIISVFSPQAMNNNKAVYGLSFLIGYFSDSAIAKLNELAITLFGATGKENSKKNPDKELDKLP